MVDIASVVARDLVQYGYTPQALISRALARRQPRVLANSIPKAGTNLLLRSLYLMRPLRRKLKRTVSGENYEEARSALASVRPGQVLAAHLKHDAAVASALEALGVHHILMVRDPRDMVVSAYRYITYKNAGHPEHARFRFSLRDDDQRLLAMIEGGFAEDIIQFLPWLSNPSCLLVRFENLVGPAGGGTEFRQIATLQHMRDHLGLPELDQKALQALAGKLFSRTSRTFSVGRSGAWRKYFKKQHEEAFNRRFHGIMSALRYE